MTVADKKASQVEIPVLRDVVQDPGGDRSDEDNAALIAELQTELASSAFALTEQLLHAAFSEMEAAIHEQISRKLRQELPELIDKILRQHLSDDLPES
jgi:hypothetical protein